MDWSFAFFVMALCPLIGSVGYFEYRKNKLLHLERMAAIERGLPAPPAYDRSRPSPSDQLRRGLLWFLPGLGLVAFLWFTGGDVSTFWTGAGVLMACVGLAYLVFYFVEGRKQTRQNI